MPGQINFIMVTFWTSGSIRGRSHFVIVFFKRNILEIEPNQTFFQNGSPGQTTLLDRSGSKFCRTPVSKSRYLSYESKSNLKTPNIVPWPECQPEVLGRVTRIMFITFASVTDYKIYFGPSSPTPYKNPSCEVDLLICVRG